LMPNITGTRTYISLCVVERVRVCSDEGTLRFIPKELLPSKQLEDVIKNYITRT
jgi:hypothetical protein